MHEPGEHKRIANDTRRWIATQETCCAHITTRHITTVRLKLDKEIQEMEAEWLRYYPELMEERDGVCLSDMLFCTLAHMWFCNNPPSDAQVEEAFRAISTGELIGHLRLAVCQHIHPKPKHADVADLRVWSSIALIFCGNTYKTLCASLKMPAELAASMETLKLIPKNPSDAKAALKAKEDGDITNAGWLWNASANNLVKTLVPLANRVLHKEAADKFILNWYKQVSHPRPYSETNAQAMHAWLLDRSKYQCADDFTMRYHAMVYEAWLPMHSRAQRNRCKMTQFDQAMALQVMEEELGVDTAVSLTEMVAVDIKEVVKDKNHPMYNYLMLSMFNYVMTTTCKVKFFEEYYLPSWQQSRQLQKIRENNDKWVALRTERRPMIFQIGTLWYVQNQREMQVCEDATDALLRWMSIIRKTYKDKLEYGADCSFFFERFLGSKELSAE